MKLTTWKVQTAIRFTFCFFTLLIFSATSGKHDIRAYKDGDVMLGGLFNVHFAGNSDYCGEFNPAGLGHVETMIFAIESVNKNPNLLPNVTVGYDIRNYCESMALAMKIAYDFVSNSKANSSAIGCSTKVRSKPISALIGPTYSSSAVLVESLLQVANIPAISPSATSVELSSLLYKDFFRTVPPDNWQAKVMADIIEHFSWTYVAVVGMDDSYGRSGIWALEKQSFNRKSFCVAFSEFIPRLDYQQKISHFVAKIKRNSNIGVIIVWLLGRPGKAFLEEVTSKTLEGKIFIFSDALFPDPRLTTLKGSLGIEPRAYQYPAFEDHLKTITPLKNIETGAEWWEEFWKSQLNCSAKQSTDYSVAACKLNMSSDHAVSRIRNPFHSYLIDAVFALAHALDVIYNCSALQGGQATNSCLSVEPTVKGSDLTKYLRNVSFIGLTGKVRFDRFGDPLSASYDIVNFQQSKEKTLRRVIVGVWNNDTTPHLVINASNIRWNSYLNSTSGPVSFCASECPPGTMKTITTPCCWDCIECPQGTISAETGSRGCKACDTETKPNERRTKCEKLPIINITLTSATGISIKVVASIGFVLTLLVCASYIRFYDTPIVKASNREVSVLLLFGIAAMFVLPVVELCEASDFLCTATNVWRYSALTVCITALFLKLMRITGVFELDKVAQLLKPCFKTPKRQGISISAIISAAFSLIALWMAFDPPGRQKIIRSDEYIFLVCKPFYTNTGFSLFITVCAYILTVALLCTYFAFKARGIPENFNETKYIAFSMYILLLSSLAYYPVVFNFERWYVALVSCSTTLATSFGLLSCMFGPKVYVLLFRPQQNTLESVRSQVSQYSFNASRKDVLPASIRIGRRNNAVEPID